MNIIIRSFRIISYFIKREINGVIFLKNKIKYYFDIAGDPPKLIRQSAVYNLSYIECLFYEFKKYI